MLNKLKNLSKQEQQTIKIILLNTAVAFLGGYAMGLQKGYTSTIILELVRPDKEKLASAYKK